MFWNNWNVKCVIMYQEIEMYNKYKKEKQIKHNHEVFANVSALTVIAIVAILAYYVVWEVAEYPLTTKYQLNNSSTFTM